VQCDKLTTNTMWRSNDILNIVSRCCISVIMSD